MMLFIKRACKFWVALSVLLGVFTEAYAGGAPPPPTAFTAPNGTTGSNYSFNLQTMPGAAVNTGAPPAPAFSIFTPVVTAPPGALPNGINFDGTSLITGTPTLAGTYRDTYRINGGTGFGLQYLVTFNIFAPAAATPGGDSTPAPPRCNCVALTGSSQTSIDNGIVTASGGTYFDDITVGSQGATLVVTGAVVLRGMFFLNGPLTILTKPGSSVVFMADDIYSSGNIQIVGQGSVFFPVRVIEVALRQSLKVQHFMRQGASLLDTVRL